MWVEKGMISVIATAFKSALVIVITQPLPALSSSSP